MTGPKPVTPPAPSVPWYKHIFTSEFFAGVAIVGGWLASLPKITIGNAIAGLGGLLGAFAQARSNNTP